MALAFLPLAAGAERIHEEEVALRGVAFSIPDQMREAKKRTAQESGLSLLAGASLFSARDNNVYRSPRDLEQDGEFWGSWALLRADKRFRTADRLLSTVIYERARYRGFSNADFDRVHLSNWYVRRFTDRLDLEFDLDVSHRNYKATKTTGESYRRDYSYWRYAGEAFIVWDIPGAHRIKFGAEGVIKNYRETPGLESLDWTAGTLEARYRYRFGRHHYLRLWYTVGKRRYEEELAGLADGTELPTNPEEEHLYQEAIAWYSISIGPSVEVEARYTHRTKEDLFADYESHSSRGVSLGLRMRPTDGAEIRLSADHTKRRYANILREINHEFRYTKSRLQAGAGYRLRSSWWVFGSLSYNLRDTNNNEGLTYRDYRCLVSALGLSLFL